MLIAKVSRRWVCVASRVRTSIRDGKVFCDDNTMQQARQELARIQSSLASTSRTHGLLSPVLSNQVEQYATSPVVLACVAMDVAEVRPIVPVTKRNKKQNIPRITVDEERAQLFAYLDGHQQACVNKGKPAAAETILQRRGLEDLWTKLLDPCLDVWTDKNSYGLRYLRSPIQGLGRLASFLHISPHTSVALSLHLDPNSLVARNAILQSLPVPPLFLPSLRKLLPYAIPLEFREERIATLAGGTQRPHMGRFAPMILEHVLSGLECSIEEAVGQAVLRGKGRPQIDTCPMRFAIVRNHGHLVLLAHEQNILENVALPTIREFFQKRNLKLKVDDAKSHIVDIGAEQPLEYAGFVIQFHTNWRPTSRVFQTKPFSPRLAIFPAKNAVMELLKSLESHFPNLNRTSFELIVRLNRDLRPWLRYFAVSQALGTFSFIDHWLHKACWSWTIKKHAERGRNWIAEQYFLTTSAPTRRDLQAKRQWNFFGYPKENVSGHKIHLDLAARDFPILSAVAYKLTGHVRNSSAYNNTASYVEWWEWIADMKQRIVQGRLIPGDLLDEHHLQAVTEIDEIENDANAKNVRGNQNEGQPFRAETSRVDRLWNIPEQKKFAPHPTRERKRVNYENGSTRQLQREASRKK